MTDDIVIRLEGEPSTDGPLAFLDDAIRTSYDRDMAVIAAAEAEAARQPTVIIR